MHPEALVAELNSAKEYFDRSTSCLEEKDSGYVPFEGAMTTAQQVAHVAQTVDWFMEGAFRPEGFDMDFEKLMTKVIESTSLADARAWLDRAFANATDTIGSKSPEDLAVPLPEGPVMGGLPRAAVVGGIGDHTAHHRGVLTVYSRHCGHTPAMPYMDM